MNCGFEKVSRFAAIDFDMPSRKTAQAAGYDMVVAEDTVIPPYYALLRELKAKGDISTDAITLETMAIGTKTTGIKPTLVSTGVKCKLPKGKYLELSVRSSTPLKYWLILANGVGK